MRHKTTLQHTIWRTAISSAFNAASPSETPAHSTVTDFARCHRAYRRRGRRPCATTIFRSILDGSRRLRSIVEPLPICLVALSQTLVVLATLRRAKLLETPSETDQTERAAASSIGATIAHDVASPPIQPLRLPSRRRTEGQGEWEERSCAAFRREVNLGKSRVHSEQRESLDMAASF